MSSERSTRRSSSRSACGYVGGPGAGRVGGLEGRHGQARDEPRLAFREEHRQDVVEEVRRRRSDRELVQAAAELLVTCLGGVVCHVLPWSRVDAKDSKPP